MGFKMNPDQVTGLLNNDSGGSVGYRENTGIGFDLVFTNVSLKSVCNFLRQESHLGLPAALRVADNGPAVVNIYG